MPAVLINPDNIAVTICHKQASEFASKWEASPFPNLYVALSFETSPSWQWQPRLVVAAGGCVVEGADVFSGAEKGGGT